MSDTNDRPIVRTGHLPGTLRVSMAFSPDAHRDLEYAQRVLSDMAGIGFSKSVIARVGVETLRKALDTANTGDDEATLRELCRRAFKHSSGRRTPKFDRTN